jgi:hypothetical protein
VISSWLRELYLQNKRYESLISSGEMMIFEDRWIACFV